MIQTLSPDVFKAGYIVFLYIYINVRQTLIFDFKMMKYGPANRVSPMVLWLPIIELK